MDLGNMYRHTNGWYFDGSSSVKIQDYRLCEDFWIFFQFRASALGKTFFSGDVKVRGDDRQFTNIEGHGMYPAYQ